MRTAIRNLYPVHIEVTMEYDMLKTMLFEVSWEVCNKVGGIYAVVSSKALMAAKQFGDDYYTLGPDLERNPGFIETNESCFEVLKKVVQEKGLTCRFGRWDIPGKPKVILVGFQERYDSSELLYSYWKDYGVNSFNGRWDYIEPVMFATACAEVIAAISQSMTLADGSVLAHFHEWMCGAGILKLKKIAPKVRTVFTTHATVLGRSMAGSDINIYQEMEALDPIAEAEKRDILPKCDMERVSAREADCFTTVSRITAHEAKFFLGKSPDIITPNGLDLSVIPDYCGNCDEPLARRKSIFEKAGKLLRRTLLPSTRLIMISGRYEFHNKGIDLFMEALADVNDSAQEETPTVLVLCLAMGGHNGINLDAINGDITKKPYIGENWLCSHYLCDEDHDPIMEYSRHLGLDNRKENKVQFIFVPALLDGNDGFLNMAYEDVLSACELGVFPSWYEPWGYTPLESAALSVPTITTDLSGFGLWVEDLDWHTRNKSGVHVLSRRKKTYDDTVYGLRDSLVAFLSSPMEEIKERRRSARELSTECSWSHFFNYYTQAYTKAMDNFFERSPGKLPPRKTPRTRILGANSVNAPMLHSFTVTAKLPEAVNRLPELAGNLWWSQHPRCWELFASLNPKIWKESGHNPIVTIEKALPSRLVSLVDDSAYMRLYEQTIEDFDTYMREPIKNFGELSHNHPLAYFSTEYGVHECLPIYSGGLGVLSGDHLKSASDLNIPLVGVGLMYKNGYFRQQIDRDGMQKALYPENDFSQMPLHPVFDALGKTLQVSLDLPGRTLYAQVWRVQVGRIALYLMDTDIEQNSHDDRRITARLYESDRDFRIRQEILLGIGGIRMLKALGIAPSAYHMNEGHSAFLVFERLQNVMESSGLSFAEAQEVVRGGNIFTTHTPVDAGNERFPEELMRRYFDKYTQIFKISWHDLMQLGNFKNVDEQKMFEMTAFSLNFSLKSNGVSLLHGIVARHMWQDGWKGALVGEIPIGAVTNGIHVPTYTGRAMRVALTHHLGTDWMNEAPGSPVWKKITDIPEKDIWDAKLLQKKMLHTKIRSLLPDVCRKFKIPHHDQNTLFQRLDGTCLTIGFARRFAPYKRALLLFSDPDRLEKLLNNLEQPLLFIFSGKSHPADVHGGEILQAVVKHTLEPRFLGKIFFMEDYSLSVSRLLVQGCDVWLNTPRAPFEACGTSGQKVSVNGGLNLSISDGWWAEGYDKKNGWIIGHMNTDLSRCMESDDEEDAESLYELLENHIVPLYYMTGEAGLPSNWIKKMKQAMQTLTPQFSSARMLREYVNDYYIPAAERSHWLFGENMQEAKRLSAWKADIAVRFSSLSVEQIVIEGVENEEMADERSITVQASINPGQVGLEEFFVQFVVSPSFETSFEGKPDVVELKKVGHDGDIQLYTGTYTPVHDGTHVYGVRVMPTTPGLFSPFETKLTLWG